MIRAVAIAKVWAVLAAALVLLHCATGCAAFEGPANTEYTCPVFCGKYQGANVCCSATDECSRTGWPDKPCRPAPGPFGASRDAGADR